MIYEGLKGLTSYLNYQGARSEHLVFHLHSVITAVALVACSFILTATQLLGKPIECISNVQDKWTNMVNNYCWVTSTYALPDFFSKKALLCYVPKALWQMQEGGLLAKLTDGINGIGPCPKKKAKMFSLLDYLRKYHGAHKFYVFTYWGCEVLCLANLLIQMWLINTFLDGEFFSFGIKLMSQSMVPQEERDEIAPNKMGIPGLHASTVGLIRIDPLIFVFPRMTKCLVKTFGVSGTLQTLDALCVLPLNIFNEKIYIFLWFWYILLAVLLCGVILSRLVVITMPAFRPHFLHARSHSVTKIAIDHVSQNIDIGDWWLLYLLAKNMNPIVYRDFIMNLSYQMKTKFFWDTEKGADLGIAKCYNV